MRWLDRLNSLLFPLLLIVLLLLLAWLSQHLQMQWDWTRNSSNSLSTTSIAILKRASGPLEITAFTPEQAKLRGEIRRFIARYQQHKPDLTLRFVDPAQHPDEARRMGITLSSELRLSYAGREERLQRLDEQSLTNAIQRLLQRETRWLAGLSGHGERDLQGEANYDLGEFGRLLQQQGYQLVGLNLSVSPRLPDNTGLLLIASPRNELLAGELAILDDYLQQGNNLLLMIDPGNPAVQQPILELLDMAQLPGTVVDANVSELGIDNPAVALVARYPEHAAISGFNLISLYPQAAALSVSNDSPWQATPLLQTLDRSWNETGPLTGEIQRNPSLNEQAGPLTIGYVLSRELDNKQQRIVVIGDGDFLSNSYLANAGNQELGQALVRWLLADDQMLGIPARGLQDQELHLSPYQKGIIGLGSLIISPLLLLVSGGILSWRRNRA